MIVAASVTGAVLLLALLLPLAFRREAEPVPTEAPEAAFGPEQRAALFAAWWDPAEGEEPPASEQITEPGSRMLSRCSERMRGLVDVWVSDEGLDYGGPTGSDYTRLRGPDGNVNVCRMWLERQGDWQNWMDVCFDADTGQIFYLYVSRSCLRNADRYDDGDPITARDVADYLALELDGTLRRLDPTEKGAVALVSADGGTVFYAVSCVCYDRLIDVKLQCG